MRALPVSTAPPGPVRTRQRPFLLMALLAPALALGILEYGGWETLAVFLSVAFLLFLSEYPQLGTLVVVGALYLNAPAIAANFHGVPHFLAGSVALLLGVPLTYYLVFCRQKLLFDPLLGMLVAFFCVALLSAWLARDWEVSSAWVITLLLEGVVLYFLLLNTIRDHLTLKRVLWVLLLAGGLLGALSLYQELTRSYENQFAGFAQRNTSYGTQEEGYYEEGILIRKRSKVRLAYRAMGPLGDPNRFAQVLLMLLPLGLYCCWQAQGRYQRFLAGGLCLLVLSGILLTYSRGAFLTMLCAVPLLVLFRYVRWPQVIALSFLVLLSILVVAPGYFHRIQTVTGITGLLRGSPTSSTDQVILGRLTEMLAAWNVFQDHPALGVGPGHFLKYYSLDYMSDPDIAFRSMSSNRRAHTLYFELAAETGLVGITLFLALMVYLLRALWRERSYWMERDPGRFHLATALILSLYTYLSTALFLHLSYQLYLWMFVALAGISVRLLREDGGEREAAGMARAEVDPSLERWVD